MLRAHKGEVPFLFWLLPFIAGIVLGFYPGDEKLFTCIVAVLAVAVAAFTGLNLFYNKFKVYKHPWVGSILMHIILLCSGWVCCQMNHQLRNNHHFSKLRANYLVIKIIGEPRQKGIYTRFTAQVQNVVTGNKTRPATGNLLVTLVADSNAHLVNYGNQLLIPATYKPVDPPFNPAEFNYKQYLAHQNIYHQSFITRQKFRILQQQAGNPIISFSLGVRQRLVTAIKQYLHTPQAAAIASTLLLGYKADLSADVLQAYSKTGTIHVLSVSGAHVAILFVFITLLLKPIRHNRYGRLFNAALSLLAIWAYVILTGLSPAATRAAVMLSMVIISQASGRPVHNLNVLAVSAFALLLYDPFLITDVGFQLSYLAVFGLLALQPIIYEQFEFEHKWPDKFWRLCSLSLAAQLITFPLSAFYFHQFPVYFLMSNLLIILPAEAIMIVGITFLASTFFTIMAPVSAFLGYVLEQLILLMNKALIWMEHLPYASIGQIWITPWEHLLLYIFIIFLVYYLIYKKAWQLGAGLLSLLILCSCLSWKAVQTQTNSHIIFFNVKKNSAVLFQTGRKAVVVTDLLPADKNYQYSIQPCLDSLGADSVLVCKPNEDLQTTHFRKQYNLIQFMDKSVLLFNPLLQNTVLPHKIAVNYVLFTQNPHSTLAFVKQNYTFNHFIADANTSTQRLSRLTHEADSVKQKIISLKRNKSFIVASN